MRHGKKFNHLGRTRSHRKAMLVNMANSLILAKRINTTLAKAKALRKFVEPILTRSKDDTMHSRRVVFSYLNDKVTVTMLFSEIAEKIASRPGGYTRIIKLGTRLGDNAEMAMIELVDYNELLLGDDKPKKSRRRRGKKTSDTKQTTNDTQQADANTVDDVVATEVVQDTIDVVEDENVKNTSEEVDMSTEDVAISSESEESESPDTTSEDSDDSEEKDKH